MKPSERIIVGSLLIFGAVLRLRQYLSGRSLWADEAMLALNIVNRNFAELFKPLEYDQGAPLGFLFVEKLFNAIFGRHELVLRFFPLLAGLVSLWLFYLLLMSLRGGDSRRSNLLALALFAFNPQLVYYSSESKQYILDADVALGLLLLAIPIFQNQSNRKNFLLLAITGILALWFSHPALFVLAGTGVALAIQFLRTREYKNLWGTLGIGLLWLANLTILYFINLRNLSRNDYLAEYWSAGFLPLPPWSDLGWIHELIAYQFDIRFAPLLVLVLILTGWFVLFREERNLAVAFALATFFAFLASAMRLYPVNGRLSLFLIPLGILLLGKTIEFLQKTFSHNRVASIGIVTLLSGYLLVNPLVTSLQNFVSPKYYEHIRPTMQVLADSWKDGDALFVTAWAEPAFTYYAPFYGLEDVEVVSSEIEDYPDGERLKSRISPLVGEKRVWVLFSHVYEQGGFNERDYLVAYLDQIGEKRREILKSGTSVYLFFYDLSQ
ncbi:MAG: glycosyltransferase family 39 protein [Chloroflexota bacterium]